MTAPTTKRLERLSTADAALDELLDGGIPRSSVNVIAGAPGSGKTILALQMMFAAARAGRRCLYLTAVAEPAVKLFRYMELFSFFDAAVAHDQMVFADLGAALTRGPEATQAAIVAAVERHEPDVLIIDSFRAIGDLLALPGSGRAFVYDLTAQLSGIGTTTFLIGEYDDDDIRTLPIFGVADGVLQLTTERVELTSLRLLQVRKLRGSGFVEGQHFYDISVDGVRFFPRVRSPGNLPGRAVASQARVGSGVAGLDVLLGGGFPAGSTTVVQGGTGAGKTILSLAFLLEGARRGERGVLFALEETAEQLRAIALSLDWDLVALEEQGLLSIHYTSPVELSTDRFLEEARRELQRTGATRAVFDSLTSLSLGVPSTRRFQELIYAIGKHARALGTTLLMTLESRELLGSTSVEAGGGISFAADNILQVRYVEIAGRLERGVSVLKARGVHHSSELRPMTIGPGVAVAQQPFVELQGVLSGRPLAR